MEALDGDFDPISDMRASAAYRRTVARNLLRRFFLESGAGGGGCPAMATRVVGRAVEGDR
jgi:xanthine dehydrogenase small subunit